MESAQARQLCPLCQRRVPASVRYPHAVCPACAAQAVSSDGRPIQFFNQELSGGLMAVYADTQEPYPNGECFITGIPCLAEEAYLGGSIIQPR